MEELREKLEDSGLTEAMNYFSKKMAKEAHSDALRRGVTSLSKLLNKFCAIQSYALLFIIMSMHPLINMQGSASSHEAH